MASAKGFRFGEGLRRRIERAGVDLPRAMDRARLPQSLLDDPGARLTTEELFALWHAVSAICDDPAVGLVLGTFDKPEHLDVIGLAALSTRSFGEAMHQMSRHKALSCPEEISHSRDAASGEWQMHFRWFRSDEPEPEVLTDLCFAWVLSVGRHGTGLSGFKPLRVEFVRPRSYHRQLERHFGCEVLFGAARNSIVFRTTDADLPFVTHNVETLSMLAPQLDEELRQRQTLMSFPEQVRTTIQRRLTGRRPKIQEIARELRLSSRTLQRRLQEENSSFQQVLEEARRQLARHYLSQSLLELNEAAYLLGYEDSGSFIRAFRTWEGVPPAHWRVEQRARVAMLVQ